MNWSTATVYFVNEFFATPLVTLQFPWDINASFAALFLNAFVVRFLEYLNAVALLLGPGPKTGPK